MLKIIMRWLLLLELKHKIFAVLLVFIFFIEIIYPSHTQQILFQNIQGWLTYYVPVLWRPFIWIVLFIMLYKFVIHRALKLVFGRLYNLRILLVISVGISETILLYSNWQHIISFLKGDASEIPTWFGSIIATLIAAPIALLIWSFRNKDKKQDLYHAEENIRQADFHKIEEWATTFPKVEKSESESEIETNALQIAAIYQLLPYLKGEYGSRFVRPTMEIYLSLLSSWRWDDKHKGHILSWGYDGPKPGYIEALHNIFHQETEFFRTFHKLNLCAKNNWVPLRNIDLKGINLSCKETKLPHGRKITNLEEINFEGANLIGANLSGVNLKGANLIEAALDEANLEGTNLSGTHFEYMMTRKD